MNDAPDPSGITFDQLYAAAEKAGRPIKSHSVTHDIGKELPFRISVQFGDGKGYRVSARSEQVALNHLLRFVGRKFGVIEQDKP